MTSRNPALRRWAWRAAALVPGYVLAAYLGNWTVLLTIRLEAVAIFVITVVSPSVGLLLIALLAPLGDTLVPLLGAPPFRHVETLLVAFFAGWLAVLAAEDEPHATLPTSLVNAAWIFTGVLVASVGSNALQLYRESPALLWQTLTELRILYLMTDDLIGVHAACALLEGAGLIVAVAAIGRRNHRLAPRLLIALIVGAVFASAASFLMPMGIAPATTLARHLAVGLPRYAATTHDVNAAASYYVLCFGAALGLAVSGRWARVLLIPAALALLEGIALTGSRAGMASAALVIGGTALLWILHRRSRVTQLIVALAALIALAAVLPLTMTRGALDSVEMRGGFTRASWIMIGAHPVFGVGVGRYYWLSRLVLPPSLGWAYGLENAHDYFLQIAAELGLAGAVAFGWTIGAALFEPLTRVVKARAEGTTLACVGGALAFLVTALSGHPFLIPEAAIAFWLVLGVLVVLRATATARTLRSSRRLAMACAGALLLTVAWRGTVPAVRLRSGQDGLGPEQTAPGGPPFREAEPFASLYAGPGVSSIEIPLRVAAGSGPAAVVGVKVPRAFEGGLRVGRDWSTIVVPLPGADPLVPRQRINLAIVAAPDAPAGTGVPRVEVGQFRILATR